MGALIKMIRKTYRMAGVKEGRVVLNNVAFLSGLQAITYILPVIILPYLFRVIGPAHFGLISFAQAFLLYFMIITDYGFSITATKEISLHRNKPSVIRDVFSSVMAVKLILTLICFAVLLSLIFVIPKFKNDWMVYVFGFGMILGNTLFPVWFFQGIERMKYIANLNILGELMYTFCIFYFVREPDDYLMVPLSSSVVILMIGLMGQYLVWRKFGFMYRRLTWRGIKKQIKAGWNIFVSVLAINAYTNTRIFAVGLLTNNTTTGFYSIAEKIANVVQTFPLSSFSQAIFPRLSKIYHKTPSQAYKMMQQIQWITINIALICMPLIFLLAPTIIRIVCGEDYPQVVYTLRLLLVAVFFISANAFRVQFLLVSGRTDLYSRIHIAMALVGLPLIILLIYSYSFVGAAISTMFIEGGILAITYFVARNLRPARRPRPQP